MMLTLPPQSPAVVRNTTAGLGPEECPDGEGVAPMQFSDGVRASQSRCSHLTGPAQSLCYAARYGVSV
jgi:hypothetical protein